MQEYLCPLKTDEALVSVQGSVVRQKRNVNVGRGEEQQLRCVQEDYRLLKANVVLVSQAAMLSARQRC